MSSDTRAPAGPRTNMRTNAYANTRIDARTGSRGGTRVGSGPRHAGERAAGYGGYVDGANALQIGYADPVELADPGFDPGLDAAAPARPSRPSPGTGDRAHDRARRHRTTVGSPTAQPAPLPVALPRASFVVAMVSLVVVGVLGVLVLNTKTNEDSFRLDRLRTEQGALDVREQQLAQALAERESTGNLRAAATRLGLVPAGAPAFIRLPDGRVVGAPQPASGRGGSPGSGR